MPSSGWPRPAAADPRGAHALPDAPARKRPLRGSRAAATSRKRGRKPRRHPCRGFRRRFRPPRRPGARQPYATPVTAPHAPERRGPALPGPSRRPKFDGPRTRTRPTDRAPDRSPGPLPAALPRRPRSAPGPRPRTPRRRTPDRARARHRWPERSPRWPSQVAHPRWARPAGRIAPPAAGSAETRPRPLHGAGPPAGHRPRWAERRTPVTRPPLPGHRPAAGGRRGRASAPRAVSRGAIRERSLTARRRVGASYALKSLLTSEDGAPRRFCQVARAVGDVPYGQRNRYR